jgi:Protein of unknown function (DUF2628)
MLRIVIERGLADRALPKACGFVLRGRGVLNIVLRLEGQRGQCRQRAAGNCIWMHLEKKMSERIYLQYPGKGEPVAVATGFSWGACLLGFIWALSKRMWFAAFVMLGVSLVLFGMGLWGETADLIGTVLSILFAIGCGIYGNQWHRWTLEKRGYVVL